MIGDSVEILIDGEKAFCELINSEYVYQGDIIIVLDETKSSEGAALKSTTKRWLTNTIFYKIEENFPDKERVLKAISHYESNTSLVFVERTNETNYIEFVKGTNKSEGSSYLGMVGGKQKIRIGDYLDYGNVIHEIGHAIGLLHEHSKSNRDEHIQIHWENITIIKRHNFSKKSQCIITEKFDFNSVMLYNSWTFSKNNDPTITMLDGTKFMSQREYLSSEDIQIIIMIYPNQQSDQKLLALFNGDPQYWMKPNVPGSHSIEISEWENAGYEADKEDLTNVSFTSDLLNGYNVLRIGMYYPRNISTEEGIAISQWVSNGGKLLIDIPFQQGINAVKDFGVKEITGEGGGQNGLNWHYHGAPLVIGPVTGPNGTVGSVGFEAMDRVSLHSNHQFIIASTTSDGYPAIVYKSYGSGKAVILFDGSAWTLDVVHPGNAYTACITDEDNLEYLRNNI